MWRLDQLWPFRRPKAEEPGKTYYCSFCGKSRDEVRKLIAGPIVYICDECIDLCNDIIAEEVEQERQLEGAASPVASLNASTWCRVCRLPQPAEEVVAVFGRGLGWPRVVGQFSGASASSPPPS